MKTLEQRFWEKVDRNGPDACWPWRGAAGPSGHGQFTAPEPFSRPGRRMAPAARVAWILTNGPIADMSLHVCHKCDYPPCVNPAHLFLGTAADNMHDAISKGRFKFPKPQHGEKNSKARLTWRLVSVVRNAYASGETLSSLARRLGFARSTLREVVNGRNWRQAAVPCTPRQAPTKKLHSSQIEAIRQRYADGGTQTQIASEFGLHQGYVSKLVRGITRGAGRAA